MPKARSTSSEGSKREPVADAEEMIETLAALVGCGCRSPAVRWVITIHVFPGSFDFPEPFPIFTSHLDEFLAEENGKKPNSEAVEARLAVQFQPGTV
jgi:hypothetical protein